MLLEFMKNDPEFVSLKYGFANSKVTVCDYLTSFLSENCTDIFVVNIFDGRLLCCANFRYLLTTLQSTLNHQSQTKYCWL